MTLRCGLYCLFVVATILVGVVEGRCYGYSGNCGSWASSWGCNSLDGCYWDHYYDECTGSPRSCSSYSSYSSCTAISSGYCSWEEDDDDEEDDEKKNPNDNNDATTPAPTQAPCDSFAGSYKSDYNMFEPSCTCEGDKTICSDRCQRCTSDGICAMSQSTLHYKNSQSWGSITSYKFDDWEVNYWSFDVEDGIYALDAPDQCSFYIGAVDTASKCDFCVKRQCSNNGARRGFLLNCSNIGYGSPDAIDIGLPLGNVYRGKFTMDTCSEGNLESPFSLLMRIENDMESSSAEAANCPVGDDAGTTEGSTKSRSASTTAVRKSSLVSMGGILLLWWLFVLVFGS